MTGLQRIIILGRLGGDPELRHTPNGNPVCNFSVAVNERHGEGKERTEWFKIVAWSKLGLQCAEHLRKGSIVYLEGRQRSREWTGEDGSPQRGIEIEAVDVQFIGEKKVIAA